MNHLAWFSMLKKLRPYYFPFIGVFVLLTIWQFTALWLQTTEPATAALAPIPTAFKLLELIQSGEIFSHIVASVLRVFFGLIFALVVGVAVGLLLGLSKNFELMSVMTFQLVRMVSPLAWMPIAVLIFGIGNAPILFLLAIGGVWPTLLNTSIGVKQVAPSFIELSKSLAATPWEILRTIVFPSMLVFSLTGLRLTLAVLWVVLVPAEMLGVDNGLGYFIVDAKDRLAYSELTAGIVVISVIGWLLDYLMRQILKLAQKQ